MQRGFDVNLSTAPFKLILEHSGWENQYHSPVVPGRYLKQNGIVEMTSWMIIVIYPYFYLRAIATSLSPFLLVTTRLSSMSMSLCFPLNCFTAKMWVQVCCTTQSAGLSLADAFLLFCLRKKNTQWSPWSRKWDPEAKVAGSNYLYGVI